VTVALPPVVYDNLTADERLNRIEEPLFTQARRAGGRLALVDGDRRWSYRDLAGHVRALSAHLTQAGVGRGDRIAIFLDKTPEAIVAFYAIWTAGAIAVPVNESLPVRQIDHIVRHSESRLLISDRRKLARLSAPPSINGAIVSVDLRTDPEPSRGDEADALEGHPGGGEPAAILYTSGSTGLPKGILLSHANLLAGARIVAGYLEIRADERILSVLPFSFDYGLNQLLTSVGCGATLVLQRSHLPADICRALLRHEITALAGVPPLWIQLLQAQSPLPGLSRQPRLRYITNSGGVMPVDVVRQYRALWPDTRIVLMYGLSEAFRSTYLPPDEIDRRPSSMGRAIPETEIHVLREDGQPCAVDEVGELVHRGPTVALGYWRDPAATAAVFRPSPFASTDRAERVVYSGDLVRRDADGFLYFVGRRDQLIKSQGYRISPDEVEQLLYASGLVAEALVCAEPDPVAGQVVVGHVVAREPAGFSVERLLEYCRAEMPRYMVPRMIYVHEWLPRTGSGKLDRQRVAS
jgi:acyl-CoA ligase (AMP-forming) (exosortase A-associated)